MLPVRGVSRLGGKQRGKARWRQARRQGTLATDGKTVHTNGNRRCIPRRGYARSPGIELALIASEHGFGADDEETLDASLRDDAQRDHSR